jgi:hypothetical protein
MGDAIAASGHRALVDVHALVPTCDRPAALALTLAGLVGQHRPPCRLTVSDQGRHDATGAPEVRAMLRLADLRGIAVEVVEHRERRGLAEHRQSLLDRSHSARSLFLDDDVYLEPDVVGRLVDALAAAGCGFVGAFVEAPGAVRSTAPVDVPGPELRIEPWEDGVRPERVVPGTPAWERRHLHFAAHLWRVARRDGWLDADGRPATGAPFLLYKVAWVGGCVLYDTERLRAAGGFAFWSELPSHAVGEDVVAQLRVMARCGGAGVLPSGAWHLEVPTTSPDRSADAPHLLGDALLPVP